FVQTGGIVTTTIANAARARSRGFELEMRAMPSHRWLLGAAVGYVDARFQRFRNGGGVGIDYDGNRLPLTPRYNLDLSAQYSLPVGPDASLGLRGEFAQIC